MDDEMDRDQERVGPSGEPAGATATGAYRAGDEQADERLDDRRPPEEEAESTAAPAHRAPSPDAGSFDPLNGELSTIKERWAGLQATFVDDPADAAHQADVMVGEVLDLLRQRHQQLHEETSEPTSERTDTEDLRVQFLRYRSFFHTLLG